MWKSLAPGVLVLLALAAPAALAQEDTPRRIVVTGTGEASARPDVAMIAAGVVVQSDTAAAALAENSRAMDAVLQELRAAGLAEEDVQTSQFSVMPLYERQPPERATAPPRVVGYQVSNRVTARVREIDRLGAVLDALVGAGATNIDGPWFDLADPEQVLGEARDAAVADALAKAGRFAAAAGVELGQIISIEEAGSYAPPPRPMMRAEAMAADVPIAPGQTELSASVTITFAIK